MTSRIAHIRLSGAVALAAAATVALTACSDSTSGSGTVAAASSAASGSSSSSSSGSGGGAVTPAGDITALAKQLATATSKATSLHLVLSTEGEGAAASAAAEAGAGEGDVRTKDGGATEAFSFQFGTGANAFSLIYVDGTGYVKLPAAQQTDAAKPWAQVSASSANPAVAAIASAFDQVDKQTSLTQYATLVEGATNFQATGETEVGGEQAQGYAFDIDPAKLPNAAQFGDAVSQLGPIPATMALDEQGRPLQVVQKISVAGSTITTTITFSDYDKQVDIAAPPADQTSTG